MTKGVFVPVLLCLLVFLCNGQDFYDFSDAGDQGPPNWGDATLVIDANDLCINGDE